MTPARRRFGLHLLANQFPPLHGLRALAIVSVLQVHVTVSLAAVGLLHDDDALFFGSTSVWFGMDLFFLLSGFLIGTLLLPTDDGRPRVALGRFYARRAFRIVPLYWFVLTALALTAPLTEDQVRGLPYEYAYLTNYHAFTAPAVMPWAWSLAVEEHFYLAVPLVAAALARMPRTSQHIAALVGLWLLGFAVRYAVWASRDTWAPGEMFDALYLRTHTRFDILVAGVLLAYVQRAFGPALRERLRRRRYQIALALVPAACLSALLGPLAWRHDLSTVFAWGTVTSVMYFSLVLLLLNTSSVVTRGLSAHAFLRFATLGYAIYLVHPIVIATVVVPAAAIMAVALELPVRVVWALSLLLVLVVSTLVAYVLHLVVEKPALSIRDRVAR